VFSHCRGAQYICTFNPSPTLNCHAGPQPGPFPRASPSGQRAALRPLSRPKRPVLRSWPGGKGRDEGRECACMPADADLAPSCRMPQPWRQQRGRGRAKRAQRMLISSPEDARIRASTARLTAAARLQPARSHSLAVREVHAVPSRPARTYLPPPLAHSPCTFPTGGGRDKTEARGVSIGHTGGTPVLQQRLAECVSENFLKPTNKMDRCGLQSHAGAQSGGDGLDGGCDSFPCSWAAAR
jgi:hypothetical protein